VWRDLEVSWNGQQAELFTWQLRPEELAQRDIGGIGLHHKFWWHCNDIGLHHGFGWDRNGI